MSGFQAGFVTESAGKKPTAQETRKGGQEVFIVSEFVVLFMSRLGCEFWGAEQSFPAVTQESIQ
jgi:hypothetical protein